MKEGKLTQILRARKDILGAVEENRNLAIKAKGEGGYETQEDEWDVYDSSLADMAEAFNVSLPKNWVKENYSRMESWQLFERYIQETLSQGEEHNLTAVEFGGPGSSLFIDFRNNFFKNTVGVCLKDIRSALRKEIDEKNNHSIITGDILNVSNTELIDNVIRTLGTKKTDLIISRMQGPLGFINKHPAILDRIIRNWYSILNRNGLMFVQFEYERGDHLPLGQEGTVGSLIEKWSIEIKRRFPEIDIQVEEGVMRLHKRTGSPENLPPATQLFT